MQRSGINTFKYHSWPRIPKGKVTNSQLDTTNVSQEVSPFPACDHKAHINRRAQRHSKHKTERKHKRSTKEQGINKVSKGAKIRNRYNQVPYLTQDTNGKVTNSQLDTTNESQEVSPFPAGDHKVHINRRAQRHSKYKTEQKNKRSTKEVPPRNGQ